MKAAEFIKVVRKEFQELYDLHQLSVKSNGRSGLRCLNPEKLIADYNRTDEEILKHYLAQGANIDDADEYLAQLNK